MKKLLRPICLLFGHRHHASFKIPGKCRVYCLRCGKEWPVLSEAESINLMREELKSRLNKDHTIR